MSNGVKIIVFSALCLIWSSTWIMIKVGLEGAPPVTAAGIRFIIASIIIFAILRHQRIKLPRERTFLYLSLFLGLFQIAVPYALVYWAEQFITSGLTSVLFSTMPLTVAILARLFLGDPLTLPKVGGILIGTLGVVVIFSDGLSLGGREGLWGITAVLLSAFFASLSSIAVKRYSRAYHPLASIFVPMIVGGIVLVTGGRLIEMHRTIRFDTLTVTSIVYLAVFGSVAAFGLYYWIIKHIDVTILSYQTFIIPSLACLIGWIFLRETVTLRVAMGGGMIIAGIALATLSRSREKRIADVGPR
ncbi:MAG: EamA family transporter [Candidatus Latescibacterota bacterium]|nr:MAG: EamA family transporter [Candidatus Latescibacterota bacterium]